MKTCQQCGQTVSFWKGTFGTGLCPECQAEADRKQRVGCLPDSGGSALTGSNRARFRPEENWMESHELCALDCGHVRLFLYEGERSYLNQPPGP
jgi:hypothetical protein